MVDAVVAGALATVILLGVGASLEVGLVGGLVAFGAVFAIGLRLGFVRAMRAHARRTPRFPAAESTAD